VEENKKSVKITMKDIRAWYKANYGHLDAGDIADGYDICDIIWHYEKNRKGSGLAAVRGR